MVATVGSIAVAFSADLARYEASLKRGEKRTNDFEKRAGKSVSGVGQQFLKLGGLAKAGLAGLATGIVAGGLTGILSQIGQIANGIASIGDEAKRAGVSTRVFQEWGFVAKQNRIGIDQMVDGLKELNLRADEFVLTGKGSAAEAFQRLGYSAEELKTKLADPSELLLEIIDRLGKFDKAAQIRISDELFGGSAGERFVELLDQGEASIRTTIQRAHDLGVVLDEEIIEKAAEIDRRFNEISNTVGMKLKSAIVSAADSLIDFINSFRDFEKQRSSALQDQVNAIIRERAGLVEELNKLQTGSDLTKNARDLGFGPSTEVAKQQIAEVQAAIDALTSRENEIIDILSNRTSERLSKPTDRSWTPPKYDPDADKNRDKAAKEAERLEKAYDRLIQSGEQFIATQEAEADVFGMTEQAANAFRYEQELLNRAQSAGISLTATQRDEIAELAHDMAAAEAAAEGLRKVNEAMEDAAGNVGSSFKSLLDGTKDWKDALFDLIPVVLKLLNTMNVQAGGHGIFGGGIFQSFIGGLLGIGFKEGGFTGHGAADEPAGVVHRGEVVFSKDDVRRHGGVAAVEAMRKSSARIGSLPGFAKGGAVGSYAAEIAESQFAGISSAAHGYAERVASSSANLKERDVSADVRVFVDQDGNWQAAVERIAEGPAARAAGQVASAIPSIALGAMETNRQRRTRVISPGRTRF